MLCWVSIEGCNFCEKLTSVLNSVLKWSWWESRNAQWTLFIWRFCISLLLFKLTWTSETCLCHWALLLGQHLRWNQCCSHLRFLENLCLAPGWEPSHNNAGIYQTQWRTFLISFICYQRGKQHRIPSSRVIRLPAHILESCHLLEGSQKNPPQSLLPERSWLTRIQQC